MTALKHLPVGNHRLPCPSCDKGARDDALSVKITAPGDGVFHCFRCEWAGRIGKTTYQPIQRTERNPDWNKLDRIRALIDRSEPIRGTIGEKYLISRSIELRPPGGLFDDNTLRYVPDCWHWPSESKLPCMIGVITNAATNEIQAVHQTFLKADGSGYIDKKNKHRLFFGPTLGGVIRLTADEDVSTGLCIAEGIETAFSGLMAGYPTWVVLWDGGISKFPLLDCVESLTILTDNDEAGMKAARKCAERWCGREVRIVPAPYGDWNNRLMEISNA